MSTSGLVLELQRDAMDKEVAVSDLLRKAVVVSAKLRVVDVRTIFENELEGYPAEAELPPYRILGAELKVWNPYHGHQPLYFQNEGDVEFLRKLQLRQRVAGLEALVAGGDSYNFPFSAAMEQHLMEGMDVELRPLRVVGKPQIVGVLDAVRNSVLKWALELEQRGVVGEGLTFSPHEVQSASTVSYHITNHIGSMSNSQIQQASGGTQELNVSADYLALVGLLKEIRQQIPSLQLDNPVALGLVADIDTAVAQASAPSPKKGVIGEAMRSIRTTLEGAAGNLLASDLTQRLLPLLTSLGI